MLAKIERVAIWTLLIFMALVGNYLWEHTDRLTAAVAANGALLHEPKLQAEVYAGVPAALRQRWRDADPDATQAVEGGRWLTVRVENMGLGEAAKLTVRLEVARPIAALRAHAADGQAIGQLDESVKVAEGGEGRSSVLVQFPALAPKQADLLFVSLAPDGAVADDDAAAWAASAPQHWGRLVVTAAPDRFSDDLVTVPRFGLAPAAPEG